MYKKIMYIILVGFFTTSCQTFGEVKRGLTGEKQTSTDEFLIQKKDPLIMPPNYENLPSPDERATAKEEISSFKKTLGSSIEEEVSSTTSSSTEESILKRIRKK